MNTTAIKSWFRSVWPSNMLLKRQQHLQILDTIVQQIDDRLVDIANRYQVDLLRSSGETQTMFQVPLDPGQKMGTLVDVVHVGYDRDRTLEQGTDYQAQGSTITLLGQLRLSDVEKLKVITQKTGPEITDSFDARLNGNYVEFMRNGAWEQKIDFSALAQQIQQQYQGALISRFQTIETDLYIDTAAGNDGNTGTAAAPIKTLQRAALLLNAKFSSARLFITGPANNTQGIITTPNLHVVRNGLAMTIFQRKDYCSIAMKILFPVATSSATRNNKIAKLRITQTSAFYRILAQFTIRVSTGDEMGFNYVTPIEKTFNGHIEPGMLGGLVTEEVKANADPFSNINRQFSLGPPTRNSDGSIEIELYRYGNPTFSVGADVLITARASGQNVIGNCLNLWQMLEVVAPIDDTAWQTRLPNRSSVPEIVNYSGTGAPITYQVRRPYPFLFRVLDKPDGVSVTAPAGLCAANTQYALSFNAATGQTVVAEIIPQS